MGRLSFSKFLSITFLFVFGLVHAQAETVSPLKLRYELDLNDYKNRKTFHEIMIMDGGIKELLEEDQETVFEMASVRQANAAFNKFTSKVRRNSMRSIRGNDKYRIFNDLVEDLGRRDDITPTKLKAILQKDNRVGKPWALGAFLPMASGAGVTVFIDDNNYFYNSSYEPGVNVSGRSFAAGPEHKADDASYVAYLEDLTSFLRLNRNRSEFFEKMMAILTTNDLSDYDEMSSYAQTLLGDFLAVYTAELYRHEMDGLMSKSPWENDLAEATLISAWSNKSGYVQKMDVKKDGKYILTEGTAEDWYGIGTNGSGVGITRRARRDLQRKVCNAVKELNRDLYYKLRNITGARGDSCYRGVMEFLNNNRFRNSNDFSQTAKYRQDDVRENARALTSAMVEFIEYTEEHADEIVEEITGG